MIFYPGKEAMGNKHFGLKLWSTNNYYQKEAINLYQKGYFDYIELYSVPESIEYITTWTEVNIPYIIHAPHSMHGFNLSITDNNEKNCRYFELAYEYFKKLKAEYLIFHPGVNGELSNTIINFNKILNLFKIKERTKILIENKPLITLTDDPCVGSSPDEISRILNECNVGFVLDITHAVKYSIAADKKWEKTLGDFMKLKPSVIHVSDALMSHPKDEHLHIGSGDFNFEEIFSICNSDYITLETVKDSKENLEDFKEDIIKLKEFI